MILEILHASKLPGRHLKTKIVEFHPPLEFSSIILDWSLRIYISDNFLGDADVAGWGWEWGNIL